MVGEDTDHGTKAAVMRVERFKAKGVGCRLQGNKTATIGCQFEVKGSQLTAKS